jgi:hypothetical protein
MKYHDLPDRWKDRLAEYIHDELGEDRDQLGAYDFPYHLKISFPDGSTVFFYWAFFIPDPEQNEAAVFTEHCGYHLFPWINTEFELVEVIDGTRGTLDWEDDDDDDEQ